MRMQCSEMMKNIFIVVILIYFTTSLILATFSLDGSVIYAINDHQELFLIDPLNVQILFKRRINELGISSDMIPTQMMQVTSNIMVIGCLCKSSQEQIEDSTPYLLILTGDLLNPEAKMDLKSSSMISGQIRKINPEKLPDFRFHYVKER